MSQFIHVCDDRANVEHCRPKQPGWDVKICHEILEIAERFEASILHMFVDQISPQGSVYMKCPNQKDAETLVRVLHGLTYNGRQIQMDCIPVRNLQPSPSRGRDGAATNRIGECDLHTLVCATNNSNAIPSDSIEDAVFKPSNGHATPSIDSFICPVMPPNIFSS